MPFGCGLTAHSLILRWLLTCSMLEARSARRRLQRNGSAHLVYCSLDNTDRIEEGKQQILGFGQKIAKSPPLSFAVGLRSFLEMKRCRHDCLPQR